MERREALLTWLTILILAIAMVIVMWNGRMFGGQRVGGVDDPTVPRHTGTGLYYFGEFSDTSTHIWIRPNSIQKIMLAKRRGARGGVDDWEVTVHLAGVIQRVLYDTEEDALNSLEKALREVEAIEQGRKLEEYRRMPKAGQRIEKNKIGDGPAGPKRVE